MRTALAIVKYFLLAVVLYVGAILLYGTLTDWAPTGTTELRAYRVPTAAPPTITDSVLTFTSWNVGYGGLGPEAYLFYGRGDFFWTTPGGVRPPRDRVTAAVAGQQLTVRSTLSDFFLLQELDTAARRSYYTQQLDSLTAVQPDYAAYYAPNFQTNRVPLPLFQPWDHYGYVRGGLVTLSRYRPSRAERIQLPGEYPWPTKLFQLDRCALRQVFPVADGKELALYNVHLSAFDKDGSMRRQQIGLLRELALADYAAGRYVVVGGDWNHLPPGFNWFSLNPTVERTVLGPQLAFDYMPPGWKYAFDPGVATVRDSNAPYVTGRTQRSVIDFFLISPNLRIRQVKGLEQDFRYSDHQPIYVALERLD